MNIFLKTRIYFRKNMFISAIVSLYRNYFAISRKRFGYIDKTSRLNFPILIRGIENVYLYEDTHILSNSMILAPEAKFIMKRFSGAAQGFTVITGNHYPAVGEWFSSRSKDANILDSKDVIVEEDVWIAANVTLLSGVVVGRGSTIGAGSVCRNNIPPYAIVAGNPAKIVGFNFSPEEIIEHEKKLYPENERLKYDYLEKNYNKYFINRILEIKTFLKN